MKRHRGHLAFVAVVLFSASCVCAQRATVKIETAHVYSHHRTSKDEIVTSLKRGDVVFVEFTSTSSEGEWCSIRESPGITAAGYMPCAGLELERVVQATTRISETPPANAPSDGGHAGEKEGSNSLPYLVSAASDGRTATSENHRPAKPEPEASIWHRVKYIVDGGGIASVTYRNESGGTDQITVELPWSQTFYGAVGKFLYLSAQKQPIPRNRSCDEVGIGRPFECYELDRLRAASAGPISTTICLDQVPLQTAQASQFGTAAVSGSIINRLNWSGPASFYLSVLCTSSF